MPPRTQSGPAPPPGSSTTAIDGSKAGSIGSPVALSQTTSRPEWQFAAISSAVLVASGSPDPSTRSQIPAPRMQNRAWEQNPGASLSRIPSPSIQSARSRYGTRLAVSVPSNPIREWVPSQNGGVPVCPHRQRLYVSPTGYGSPSRHSIDSPSASQTIRCLVSGTPPVTR